MKVPHNLWLACLVPITAVSAAGIVGIGIDPYNPACAHACNRALSSNLLSCSSHDHTGGHMHGGAGPTTPQCRAGDSPWLTTLAWCMSTHCARYGTPTSRLEKFWEDESTGDPSVAPKWGYGQALQQVARTPSQEVGAEDTINATSVLPETAWEANYRTLIVFEEEERVHARYGVIILIVGFGTPILLTLLGYLPHMTVVLDRVKPHLLYTSTVGTYHVRALPYLLGNAPTIGQGVYIALMVLLNVFLTAVNYKTTQPFVWYETNSQEVLAFVMFRTGLIAFALAPLVILFSARNNILLWLTNWSHSTYLLLHRWIARIFGIQVILHSVLALALYIDTGSYPAEEKMPYWIWGAVATVAVSIMLIASGLYVRRLSYEVFLISHVILAVFVIVGSWYHVDIHFERKWGYEVWIYAACAVWFFDRAVRVLRVLKTGLRYAKVTDVGDDFVRVDVEGVHWGTEPGRHVYAFFPTLNPLKPWENHPFSVLPTAVLRSRHQSISSKESSSAAGTDGGDIEKHNGTKIQTKTLRDANSGAGITLFIRKSTGMTKSLKAHDSLPMLLDGPYPNNAHGSILKCDRLLLLGGGIGITGLLPWVNAHPNAKLCWSVREAAACLVQAIDGALSGIVEQEIRVGQRLDIAKLLGQEVKAGWNRIGVVVCGPGGMCDDVRAAVAAAAWNGETVFELQVDAYSW